MSAHRPTGSSRRSSRGFTFLEVMVAVLILVIGLIPVYSLMESGARRASYNKMRAFAASLAQNYLERIRATSLEFLDNDLEAVMSGGAGGVPPLFADDEIWALDKSAAKYPQTPEFKKLVERWKDRAGRFDVLPMEVKKSYANVSMPLEDKRMRLLGVLLDWNPDRAARAQRPTEPDQLSRKRYQMSLFCLAGETLFHPPPVEDISPP